MTSDYHRYKKGDVFSETQCRPNNFIIAIRPTFDILGLTAPQQWVFFIFPRTPLKIRRAYLVFWRVWPHPCSSSVSAGCRRDRTPWWPASEWRRTLWWRGCTPNASHNHRCRSRPNRHRIYDERTCGASQRGRSHSPETSEYLHIAFVISHVTIRLTVCDFL